MQVIRWGIIGCGDVTEIKSGPAFNKIKDSQLVAVMRRTTEKARDYAQRHQVPKWYDDADKLIHDADVNAIYIATPPGSHAEYAIKVAGAEKPVYVEKPMARNYAECEAMIKACQAANVPLFVAYYRRRLPSFLKVKELIDTGVLGKIMLVNLCFYETPRQEDSNQANPPWRLLPELAGGGYLFDMGSHQLDILDFLLGPIVDVWAIVTNQGGLYSVEDTVCAGFKFESGVVGTGRWCFAASAASRCDRIEIIGSRGRVTFPCFALEKPVLLETLTEQAEFVFSPPAHVQQSLIQTVVDELLGRGQCPSTGETGKRTSWVLDKIIEKYRQQFY